MKIRFGQIRRGGYFFFEGVKWQRTRGTFALPIRDMWQGHAGWPFKVSQLVEVAK